MVIMQSNFEDMITQNYFIWKYLTENFENIMWKLVFQTKTGYVCNGENIEDRKQISRSYVLCQCIR